VVASIGLVLSRAVLYHCGMTGSTALPDCVSKLLWDVRKESVDVERHARFIICRVLDWGDAESVRWLLATYGEDAIRKVVASKPPLHPKTIAYWTARLGLGDV